MPTKKPKRELERSRPPPEESPPPLDERGGKDSTTGLSGRGADSVLAHLIEQERTRGPKPERG